MPDHEHDSAPLGASVKEDLIAAKALIDTPEKWGKPKNSFFEKGEEPGSLRASAMGAIHDVSMFQGSAGYEALYTALDAAVPESFRLRGAVGPLRQFNDHPDTTHADIMALFQRAIDAQDGAA